MLTAFVPTLAGLKQRSCLLFINVLLTKCQTSVTSTVPSRLSLNNDMLVDWVINKWGIHIQLIWITLMQTCKNKYIQKHKSGEATQVFQLHCQNSIYYFISHFVRFYFCDIWAMFLVFWGIQSSCISKMCHVRICAAYSHMVQSLRGECSVGWQDLHSKEWWQTRNWSISKHEKNQTKLNLIALILRSQPASRKLTSWNKRCRKHG